MLGKNHVIITLVALSSCLVLVSARAPGYWHVYENYSKEANTFQDVDKLMHPEFHDNHPGKRANEAELNSDYWKTVARKVVDDNLKKEKSHKIAKNIILFLGDGLSVTTTTATRSFLGDTNKSLAYENLPFVGMSKTYCVDRQVADSACTSTAFLCGVKANYQTIGVNAKVFYKDCDAGQVEENRTPSIAKWAIEAGKAAGLVTNMRVTHASPVKYY